MDFSEAFGGLMPGARGAVLAALLRTGTPLTGRRVHAVVGESHSLGAVQQALRDLEKIGMTTTESVGRATTHRINERHVAVAPLRPLASPLDLLSSVVLGAAPGAEAVIVFGSVARGEARADSDVDLAVIAPEAWDGRITLAASVREQLGNDCDVVHLTPRQLSADAASREPVIDEVLRDGIALHGRMPRRSRVAS